MIEPARDGESSDSDGGVDPVPDFDHYEGITIKPAKEEKEAVSHNSCNIINNFFENL